MTDGIEYYPEGTASEERYGFTRVLAAGPLVATSGTTASSGSGPVGNAYDQAAAVMERLLSQMAQAGAGPEHVFRVHAYATDVRDADEILEAVREALGGNKPATTLVEARLVSSTALVEIELEAYRPI